MTGQPLAIGANELLAAENMHAVASGYLIGRAGQINYNSSSISTFPIKSLYRFYKQNEADFYSDLFPSANYQNFMARDKEISAYTGNTVGIGAC